MFKRIQRLLNITPHTPSYPLTRVNPPCPSNETIIIDPDGNYFITDSCDTYYITDAIKYHDQEIQE